MRKTLNIIFFLLLLMTSTITYAETKIVNKCDSRLTKDQCLKIIDSYCIDPKIKSVRGWKHVFKSEKWKKIFMLDKYTDAELICLEEYILLHAMNIKQYDTFIGVELSP